MFLNNTMKDSLKIIGILTVVCMLCGFLLSFVYSSAKTKIEENQKNFIYRAIYAIARDAESVEEVTIKGKAVYRLFDTNKNEAGYAFLCKGQGYQGEIKILFGIDKGLKILQGIEIIESNETPGLGARINEPSFKEHFKKLDVLGNIECIKNPPQRKNQIQAITSATVSSKAVVNIVNEGIKELKLLLADE